jgi:hypothetical protein
MTLWERVRRTGQREAKAFVFTEIQHEGHGPGGAVRADGAAGATGAGRALIPGQGYFRVWLCEMFLGKRSTLTADWLPAAHTRVVLTRSGRPPLEFSKVLRPDPDNLTQGVKLNYPLTDLVPYNGGVVEVEAALVAWRQASRIDAALQVLQVVSALPVPSLAPALKIAEQVTSAARTLVQKGDGEVHLDLHQSFVSPGDQPPDMPGTAEPGNVLSPTYLAVLLADENEVSPGTLRVVDSRLHQVGTDGSVRHLLGWDFLLLRVETRSTLDDFWLPEIEDMLDKAVEALTAGLPAIAAHYRSAAIALTWRSPLLAWADRDRVIGAVKGRFDQVAGRPLGAVAPRRPASFTAMVQDYGPSIGEVLARGAMTQAGAFAP